MTSKLVVNTIEADTGISSVSFASSISLSSTSVFHFGDAGLNIGADTNISRAGNGILAFNINGGEKVRIDSNGKVGIATDTGSGLINTRHAGTNQQVLHVRADLGSTNGRSLNLYTPDTDNSTAPFRFQTGNGYLFQCDGEDVFTIAHDRRVGIGTNAPSAKLEVQDRSGGTLIGLSVGTQYGNASFGGYNNYPAIMNSSSQPLIYCDTNNDRTEFFGDTVGFGTTCAFRVNGAERLRINSSGSVAIGTDSPTGNALTLGGTAAAVVCQNPNSGYGANQGLYFGNGNGTIGYVWNYENDQIRFATNNTERVRIFNNGHIAIGDDISNDTGMFKVIAADGQSDDQYVGQFKNLEATTNRNWGLLIQAGSSSTDESLRVRNGANNADHLTVRGDGVVTKPKHPAFNVKGGNMTRSDTSGYICQFNDDSSSGTFDNGNNFNTSTYKFVAPVSGHYYFFTNIRLDQYNTGYIRTAILSTSYGAGSSYWTLPSTGHVITYPTNASGIMTVQTSTVMYLAVNHEAWVYQDPSADSSYICYLNESSFGGYLIG